MGRVRMRIVLVVLGIAVLLLALAMIFGLVNIDQTRSVVVQAPAFRASVGSVKLGTEQKTVPVPTLQVEKAGNSAAPAQ